MLPFATEFPIKPSDNKAALPAEVYAWISGMKQSAILNSKSARELDGENVYLIAENGEELRMRELRRGDNWEAVGFRHDIPDNEGRLWRTECVLRRGAADDNQGLIRFRTHCIAREPGAHLAIPKKPYLIKALLKSAWGGEDGELDVCDKPIWLQPNDEDDLILADMVISGTATNWLPVIYISATDTDRWLISENNIEKLAYDLGGIAHVVVEPSRKFSLRLRDRCKGRNLYGGTMGIALPHRGFVRRLYLGLQLENTRDLIEEVKTAAIGLRGNMPSTGWDWTELQENVLRNQRTTLRDALLKADAEELFESFAKQVEDLQEENIQLKEQLTLQVTRELVDNNSDFNNSSLILQAGKEIYPGELHDRIRLAAQTALTVAESQGIDERSTAVWTRIVERIPRSPALDELLEDLSRATKDPKRMADEVSELLQRHGYRGKSENKHIRLENDSEYVGLQNLTISKTPSDQRSLKNLCKQIERTLGIGKLPK